MVSRDTQLILVVDDSAFIRKKCSNLLVKAGYRVVEAEDGIEALAKYVDEKPDLALLGIGMPRMSGIHALHAIMRVDPTAKVVIISAMGQRYVVENAIKEGAREFLLKPFRDGRVLDTVKKVLDNSGAEPAWE